MTTSLHPCLRVLSVCALIALSGCAKSPPVEAAAPTETSGPEDTASAPPPAEAAAPAAPEEESDVGSTPISEATPEQLERAAEGMGPINELSDAEFEARKPALEQR